MGNYEIWKSTELVKKYLSGTRASFPGALQQIEVMKKVIRANRKDIGSILDLGCGDGILGSIVLDEYRSAEGVFLDFSEDMLTAARIKLEGFKNRTEFVKCDYGQKGWRDAVIHKAPYDIIVSGFSIHHQIDNRKKEIYAEIFDLLRPDGIFINVEHVLSGSNWIGSIHDENFIDSLYDYNLKTGAGNSREEISKDYYNRPDKFANMLATVDDQCSWLKDIGYSDVDCYYKMFEFAVFGGRKPAI